jgi:hypothetical protein
MLLPLLLQVPQLLLPLHGGRIACLLGPCRVTLHVRLLALNTAIPHVCLRHAA